MANNDAAEALLVKLAKEKGLKLISKAEDRLKGSFIWTRAVKLSGGALSAAQVEARVRSELDQVTRYLQGLWGQTAGPATWCRYEAAAPPTQRPRRPLS